MSPEYRALSSAHAALMHAPKSCRFHGTDFGFLGWQWGEPRCESCQQPWRVTEALRDIGIALGIEIVPSGSDVDGR